jgi:hypothetical protein
MIMSATRFGEILSKLVPLSGHDIEEILSEQNATRQRFGDIALGMGLCRPEHIWRATSMQLNEGPRHVDLTLLGVDSQALQHIPGKIARMLGVIPLRVSGEFLVVAAHSGSLDTASEVLPQILSKQIRFVIAESEHVQTALAKYYPKPPPAPRAADAA